MHTIIANTLLIISLLMQYTPKVETETQQITADLDGDGTEETITLEYKPDFGDYILTIDIANAEGWLEPYLLGMELIDIDTSDDRMEIAVETAGPSDDYETIYYTLVNNRVEEIGHVYGYATEEGNGDVHSDVWMGFWARTDVHRLDPSTGLLEHINQEIVAVMGWYDGVESGIECTVLEPFPIYVYPDGEDVIADLEEDNRFSILACYFTDPVFPPEGTWRDIYADWYMLRTESGITGWAQLGDFRDKVDGTHWAD